MSQTQFWILLGKKLNGEATAEELDALQKHLETYGDEALLQEGIEHIWNKKTAPEISYDKTKDEDERAWLQLVNTIKEPMSQQVPQIHKNSMGKLLWPAAAVLLLIALSWYSARYSRQQGVLATGLNAQVAVAKKYVVPKGERKHIILPDGTSVWLNANSYIHYAKDFGKTNREVWLSGEAFFDVTHNTAHPFVVNTSAIAIKVLGTVFNVKDYKNDKSLEATLLKGKIQVTFNNEKDRVLTLSPNEKLVIFKSAPESRADSIISGLQFQLQTIARKADTTVAVAETAWLQKRLAFNNETFEEVAHMMERWYNVNIYIKDNALKDMLISGTFENESLEEALQTLQQFLKFTYTKEGNNIYLQSAM